MTRRTTTLGLCALLAALSGCRSGGGGGGDGAGDDRDYATRGLRETDRTVRTGDAPRPALSGIPAYVNGRGVAWETLHTRMAERVGGAVLQEVVLETLLEERCASRGITIDEEDLARERRLLVETLRDDGFELDEASSEQLLGELLRRRNLGEAGFRALLRRTAMSRALVAGDVELSESAVERAHDLRYGTRYRARLIVAPTPSAGAEARRRLAEGEDFGAVARDLSTDSSASNGGRIPPVHPADLSWPAAIRQAVERARIGEPTTLIAVDNGYALITVEEAITPPDEGLSRERRLAIAERDARLEAQRLLMARLARDLLSGADVQVRDPALARVWRSVDGQSGER